MNWLVDYLRSSIGKKQIMGLTGVPLYGYLFVHLIGNIGLLAGPETFNRYSYVLLNNLAFIIVPIEFFLLACFVAHIVLAFWLRSQNKAARPAAYLVPEHTGEGKKSARRKSLHSAKMIFTGMWILIFTLIHVAHFRYGAVTGAITVTYDGIEMRDLYTTVMQGLSVWWYSLSYIITMLVIASHLYHGVQSSFQSLGLHHPKYWPMVQGLSKAYAIIITVGFISLIIWGYLQGGVG